MCKRNRPKLAAFAGIVLTASLIAAAVYAQTQTVAGSTPAPASPASPAPPVIHYHYHFHQYGNVPLSSLMYPTTYATPATGATNMSYPMLPNTAPPTQAQPYPPGYVPGPFAPTGFQNMAPAAPTAQGVIHIFLPSSDAAVYINGQELRVKKGKDRKFTTPVLPSNREFQYWVTATFQQGGENVTQYRKAIVGAGEYTVVDFTRPPEENPVRLPAGPVGTNSVVPPTPD
jgi:uncharacterized protein (TIGR03000 family)